jgi:hypothetical protein
MKDLINRRIWDKEYGVSYFCTICGQYRPEKDFYKDNKSSWGKSSRCKRHFTKKDKDDDGDNAHLKFSKISESDFIGARKLLQKLGYDTSQNVAEQFNKKHKLN